MDNPAFAGVPGTTAPQYTFIVPYRRTSPIQIPRRDLVLSATDSLALRVVIVESDNPDAEALELSGGIGGPACRLVIWRDGPGDWWDYGAPATRAPEVLWSGVGVLADQTASPGSFDITMDQATMSDWPRRCGFWLFLDWDGGLQSELLAHGRLHVTVTSGAPTVTAIPIVDDATLVPITTD